MMSKPCFLFLTLILVHISHSQDLRVRMFNFRILFLGSFISLNAAEWPVGYYAWGDSSSVMMTTLNGGASWLFAAPFVTPSSYLGTTSQLRVRIAYFF